VSDEACTAPTPVTTLLAYWLGELEGAREAELEKHLFGCESCTARFGQIVQLGEGIQHVTRAGGVHVVLTAEFVRRLQASGMRLREYRLQPGGSVNCTVLPEDDLVVAHLHATRNDVQRLDLVLHDETSGARWRAEDVAFDPAAAEVVMASSITALRQLSFATLHAQLLAVASGNERVIGEYTFNHAPHQG
jgi:anti-sigma factor RsiW